MDHQWYDVTSKYGFFEEEVCINVKCACGCRQHRRRPILTGLLGRSWDTVKASNRGEWQYPAVPAK